MEYHSDRFEDFSLLIFKKDELIGLLPVNRVGKTVYSHQGLTFGSFILKFDIIQEEVIDMIDNTFNYLRSNGVINISIKLIPEFYCKKKCKELENYLHLKNEVKCEKLMVFAIDYYKPFSIHKTKLRRFRNNKYNFVIKESDDFSSFWEEVLIPRLDFRYNTKPVHSLNEISLLASRFPTRIKQFNIYLENTILAGITIFDSDTVVKSQYGAATEMGKKTRALDYLFLYLIYKYQNKGKRYFSMGTASDNSEMGYNSGMKKQKEELGCRIYNQKILSLNLS